MISLLAALVLVPHTTLAKGDHWVAERVTRYVNTVEEIDMTDVEKLEWTVLGPSASNLSVEFSKVLVETRIGENHIPPPKGTTPDKQKALFSSSGDDLSEPPKDPVDLILLRLNQGSSATEKWKAKFSFQPVSDGRRMAKFTYDDPDEKVHADGTITFLAAPRVMVKVEITAKNLPLPGGPYRVTAMVKQTVAEPLSFGK